MRLLKIALLVFGGGVLTLCLGFFVVLRYAAWADGVSLRYMKWQCDKYGGEFIERTVDGVEGFLLMRVREPTHIYSELRAGRVPEAPYGHTTFEAFNPGGLFMSGSSIDAIGFRYIELPNKDGRGNLRTLPRRLQRPPGKPPIIEEPYVRYSGLRGRDFDVEGIAAPTSRYGVTFEELPRTWMDRWNGVWRSEIRVVELATNEVLAVHRGFFFFGPWRRGHAFCPRNEFDFAYDFVAKVLKPTR